MGLVLLGNGLGFFLGRLRRRRAGGFDMWLLRHPFIRAIKIYPERARPRPLVMLAASPLAGSNAVKYRLYRLSNQFAVPLDPYP